MNAVDLGHTLDRPIVFRTMVRALFENARHKAFLFCMETAFPSEAAAVDTEMPVLLAALAEASGNAVAVIADRPFAEVDRRLAPLVLPGCAAGGLEVRTGGGAITRLRCAADLDPVRRLLARPGVLPVGIEIVDHGFAVELRHEAACAAQARACAHDAVALAPAVFALRTDETSTRIGFAGVSRARALHRLMNDPFFIERIPIVFGSGCADQEIYGAVRCFGGTSIEVGDRADHGADIALPALNDVRWLMRDFLAELG
mgnify:CR=1 FL=1